MLDKKIQIGPLSLDAKSVIIGLASLILSVLTGTVGYQVGNQPREVVCKEDITRAEALKDTVESLQTETHKSVMDAQQSCIQREQGICDDRILKYKERVTRLRCKICERKNDD